MASAWVKYLSRTAPPKGRQKIVVRGYDVAGFRVSLVRTGGGKSGFPEYTPGCRFLTPFGTRNSSAKNADAQEVRRDALPTLQSTTLCGQPDQTERPQQRLYLLPLPQGHGSFRPGLPDARMVVGGAL
jgi:hypothetical protein